MRMRITTARRGGAWHSMDLERKMDRLTKTSREAHWDTLRIHTRVETGHIIPALTLCWLDSMNNDSLQGLPFYARHKVRPGKGHLKLRSHKIETVSTSTFLFPQFWFHMNHHCFIQPFGACFSSSVVSDMYLSLCLSPCKACLLDFDIMCAQRALLHLLICSGQM